MEPGTADDLVADADRKGLRMTTRGITEWVQKGLLDHPDRRNLGQGKGSIKGLFRSEQRMLFAVLLDKRLEGPGVARLLVIPIAIWLYWGDPYVPTRQAAKALKHWAKAYETTPAVRADTNVEALINQIAAEDAVSAEVDRLRALLVGAAQSRTALSADLPALLSSVIDPHGVGRRPQVDGIPIAAEALIWSWVMQRRARSALADGTVSAAVLEQARVEVRTTLQEYYVLQAARPILDPNPFVALSAPGEMQYRIAHAASDLMLPVAHLLAKESP